jgi:hypothetical protein
MRSEPVSVSTVLPLVPFLWLLASSGLSAMAMPCVRWRAVARYRTLLGLYSTAPTVQRDVFRATPR